MSCHTWCYNKEKETDKKEIKNNLINYFKENIQKGNLILNSSLNNEEKNEWTSYLEYAIPTLQSLEDNKLNNEELYRLYEDLNDNKIIHNDTIYSETEFHDIFRISSYPEDVLTTKEATLKYINDNICHIYNMNAIEDFWEKYPEGLIYFG